MGKKNKRSNQQAAASRNATRPSAETVPNKVKREVLEIIGHLLDKCTQPLGVGSQEWIDFTEINGMVEMIQAKQKGFEMKHSNREEGFGAFTTWLQENGVETSAVSIADFPEEGCGLKATRDIGNNEKFISIPRKLMMTTETASASSLGALIKEDRILQAMPNVALSLHLLAELKTEDSFWKPYLHILPSTYTTPLYFTPEEVQLLKGSPLLSEVINQRRNIARQYAYFYRLFQTAAEASKLPIKDFCYDDYRWAVSTVMTRQNQIPNSVNASQSCMALIPLWDMCNHTEGQITTDFNVELDCSECFALRPFTSGEQVYIYYGSRSNAELLLHNGFIYEHNINDRVHLRLGVSKNDPLYSRKAELLTRLAMLANRIFRLHCGEDPVDSELLAFIRIFNMTEEQLETYLRGPESGHLVGRLRDFGEAVTLENEVKAWTYLETRAMIMLKGYSTTSQEDQALLDAGDLGMNAGNAITLRHIEKTVLEKTQKYAARLKRLTQEKIVELDAIKQKDAAEDIEDQMNLIDIAASS